MILRTCAGCGISMKIPDGKPTQIYCSRACRRSHKHTDYTCETCGKNFEARQALQGRKRFCSRACKDAAPIPLKTYPIVCTVCGTHTTLEGGINRRRTTCSAGCANIAKASRLERHRILKPCEVCGKTMETFPSRKTRFCSRQCAAVGWSRKTRGKLKKSLTVPCDYCGKPVTKPKSRIDIGRTFCGNVCYHAWDALYKSSPAMIERLAERMRNGFGVPSKLEDRVAEWLTHHGIAFNRQVLLKVYLTDFKAGATHIEVQGCYWHGCPTCFPQMTPLQKRRSSRDKSLQTYCRKRNIPLITIWEHDIDRGDFSALMPLLASSYTDSALLV